MVLCTPKAESFLPWCSCTIMDQLCDTRRPNESQSSDALVVAQRLDNLTATVDHLKGTPRHTSLDEQLCGASHRHGNFLTGFEDHGVARDQRDGDGPHRHHEREIARHDAR